MAVSAVIQSAARLERGRTLNNVVIIHGSGWTQLDQIWHAGGRGGEGREGMGGEGRGGEGEGMGGGRGGEGRGGQGRGGDGRGGGRGGEGTVHTFHKPEPLWPRSLAGHPRSGWPASSIISLYDVFKDKQPLPDVI